jgi:putative hemolysin
MSIQTIQPSIKANRKLTVRIAENQLEIERALALRYDVF